MDKPNPTDFDQAVEYIIGWIEGAQIGKEKVDESKKTLAQKEKETADSVRKRSMERLAEKRERWGGGGEMGEGLKKKKTIGIGKLSMELFKEKSERELSYRGDELKLKRQEQEPREGELMLREREQGEKEKGDDIRLTVFLSFVHILLYLF